MLRGPPPPRNGFPIPLSEVTVIGRKPWPIPRQVAEFGGLEVQPGLAGSAVTPPLVSRSTSKFGSKGLEKLGWLKMLKKSARNSMLTRSPSFVFFTTEKSKLWKLGPTKALRRKLPKW